MLPVSGHVLRHDGESHSDWWRRVLRDDPCAYCDNPGGTVDHIVPRAHRPADCERWPNLIGACGRCNESKATRALLHWLLLRRDNLPRAGR